MTLMKLMKGESRIETIMGIQTQKKNGQTYRAYILLDESTKEASITKILLTRLNDLI
jgi:hypothetical protein